MLARLAVDMDIHGYTSIHGYIHVWILDFSHPVDISMDIMLSHLLIKLNTYNALSLQYFLVCRSYSLFSRLFMLLRQMNNYQ